MNILTMIDAWSKTWKGIVTLIAAVAILSYLIFYVINSKIGEQQNELIPLEESEVPTDSDFDDLCAVSNEGESCPDLSEPKVRRPWNPAPVNR